MVLTHFSIAHGLQPIQTLSVRAIRWRKKYSIFYLFEDDDEVLEKSRSGKTQFDAGR